MSASPNRLMAIVVGAVYLLLGIGGFAVTAGIGFFAVPGGLLLGLFEVNGLHNVVAPAARRGPAARRPLGRAARRRP